MSKRKPAAAKAKPETVVGIESTSAEGFLALMRQEAMAAAMAAVRQELQGQAQAPQSLGRAKPPEREAPQETEAGKPWHPAPGSRYIEPGTRISKRGRLDSKPAKSKVFSAFLDPNIVEPFRQKCKRLGITLRYGVEDAMKDWTAKQGAGEREVEWRR